MPDAVSLIVDVDDGGVAVDDPVDPDAAGAGSGVATGAGATGATAAVEPAAAAESVASDFETVHAPTISAEIVSDAAVNRLITCSSELSVHRAGAT